MRFASLLLLAVGAVVAGVYYSKNRGIPSVQPENLKTKSKEPIPEQDWSDKDVDERLDDSFPASDPPSWSTHLH